MERWSDLKSVGLYRTREEIRQMTEEEFFQYMDSLDRFTTAKRNNRKIGDKPHFTSFEEIKAYYNAITFEEFEREFWNF